jgi:hypothetical protein
MSKCDGQHSVDSAVVSTPWKLKREKEKEMWVIRRKRFKEIVLDWLRVEIRNLAYDVYKELKEMERRDVPQSCVICGGTDGRCHQHQYEKSACH